MLGDLEMNTPFILGDRLETALNDLINDIPYKNADIIRVVVKAFLEKYLWGGCGHVRVTARQDESLFYIEVEVIGLKDGSWNAGFEFLA